MSNILSILVHFDIGWDLLSLRKPFFITKLLQVCSGVIFDVTFCYSSKPHTFSQWIDVILNEGKKTPGFVPWLLHTCFS
ncbi:hypothetical protein ACWF7H_02985 [Peribacillus butanolivorans]|uniref:hypothetical protein n=1 Tax=Peribacillus butanolivorans TaxID=421767 RepID=UPI00367E9B53